MQVSAICGQIRPDRQTLLFSATFAPTLEHAAAAWLTNPVRIYAEADAGAPTEGEYRGMDGEAGYLGGNGEAGDRGVDDDGSAGADGWEAAERQGLQGEGSAGDGFAMGEGWAAVPPTGIISPAAPLGIIGDPGAPLGILSPGPPLGICSIPASVTERFLLCEGGQRRQALLEVLAGLGLVGKRGMGGVNGAGVNGAGVNEGGEGLGGDGDGRSGAGGGRSKGGRGRKQGGDGKNAPGVSRRPSPRVLVFVSEIKSLRGLASCLKRHNVSARVLHGSLDQRDREEALSHFRSGTASVLLATDVAARGVHVPRLEAIVNFDLPPTPAQYVHRAGRTGRHGAPGLAVTLLRPGAQGKEFARGVVAMRKGAGMRVPEVLRQMAGEGVGGWAEGGGSLAGEGVGLGSLATEGGGMAAELPVPAMAAEAGGVVAAGVTPGGMSRKGAKRGRSAMGDAGGAVVGELEVPGRSAAAGVSASGWPVQRGGGGGAVPGGGSLADFAAAFA
jgi:hypothetical protein